MKQASPTPGVRLRLPSSHNSNTYDGLLSRVFVIVPMQEYAGKFLLTMKDYPPSQTLGSFNLEKIQQTLESGDWREVSRITTSTRVCPAVQPIELYESSFISYRRSMQQR
jgi:hypothetical protein